MSPRRRGGTTVSAALAAVLLALTPAVAPGQATTPRIGAHAMILPGMSAPEVDGLFLSARRARIGIVRADVVASILFPRSEQQPEWQSLDVVRAAARTHHLPVLGLLYATPPWLAGCAPPIERSYQCPPKDRGAWQRIVERIVARAPEIRYWEVLNEADHPGHFTGDAAAYAGILRATGRGVRRANPRAKVVFTGACCTEGWTERVLALGVAGSFDVANAHFRGGVGKLDDMTRKAAATFGRHGFHGPLWVTETGYPSDAAYQWDAGFTGGPAAQSAYLVTAVPAMLGAGAARVFVTLRDTGHPWGIFGSEGILTWPGHQAKPSFFAVRSLAERLIRRAARRAARARALRDSARARARLRRARAR